MKFYKATIKNLDGGMTIYVNSEDIEELTKFAEVFELDCTIEFMNPFSDKD